MLDVQRGEYYDRKRRPVYADRDVETVSALKQLRQQYFATGAAYEIHCKKYNVQAAGNVVSYGKEIMC